MRKEIAFAGEFRVAPILNCRDYIRYHPARAASDLCSLLSLRDTGLSVMSLEGDEYVIAEVSPLVGGCGKRLLVQVALRRGQCAQITVERVGVQHHDINVTLCINVGAIGVRTVKEDLDGTGVQWRA